MRAFGELLIKSWGRDLDKYRGNTKPKTIKKQTQINKKHEINCHSSTPKSEVLDFVRVHRGKLIKLHYECNIIDTWGDDDISTFNTSEQKEYDEIINIINTHYIHNIEVK